MATVQEDLVAGLEGFSGRLLGPDDDGYDEARRIHNGLIDKRPALIARCLGTADVAAAVDLAREHGLEVSVRGGGHNVAGKAVTDGGVMIDLALMKGMHVDPAGANDPRPGRRHVGRAEPRDPAARAGRHRRRGVDNRHRRPHARRRARLLMGKFGLSTDNLISAEVVTADGRVLTASDEENPDLFWAIRGGGGNFGVVTSFEYRLHPVGPIVTGGLVIHPFEAARDFLRFMREYTADLSDEMTLFVGLLHAPDGSGARLCGAVLCHTGTPEQAGKDLEPLLTFGSPLDVPVSQMPYTVVNQLIDGGFPKGALNYWKSAFMRELSDEAIDTMVQAFEACPSPMTALIFEHFHGEVTRVPVDAMAVPHREPGLNLVVPSIWMDPSTTDQNIAWTQETFAAMQPFAAERQYVNYQGADESAQDQVRRAYGPNYDRLVELKTKYDPENLFRLNQNIEPQAS